MSNIKINLSDINPYIRFAGEINYSFTRPLSITYDCRLLFVKKGNGTITIAGESHSVTAGLLIWFQPGTPYELHPSPSFQAIALDFDLTTDYSSSEKAIPPIPIGQEIKESIHETVDIPEAPKLSSPLILTGMFSIGEILEMIVEEFRVGKLFYQEKCRALFFSVIVDLERVSGGTPKRSELFKEVSDYIANHYSEPITNKQIAEKFGYDPCYLNRLTLSYTGQTLHRYVLHYRVERAIDLLLTTDYSVEEIASLTGFSGISHFSNACLSVTGARPLAYRKR